MVWLRARCGIAAWRVLDASGQRPLAQRHRRNGDAHPEYARAGLRACRHQRLLAWGAGAARAGHAARLLRRLQAGRLAGDRRRRFGSNHRLGGRFGRPVLGPCFRPHEPGFALRRHSRSDRRPRRLGNRALRRTHSGRRAHPSSRSRPRSSIAFAARRSSRRPWSTSPATSATLSR